MTEDNRTEYKQELTTDLEKEIVAFLNSREGGKLYLGVHDKTGKIIGVTNADELQLKIYYEAQHKSHKGQFSRTLELVIKKNEFNYVAYLLADENGTSIKFAKNTGFDRDDLIESNEYGYCSLVKATKAVLDILNSVV